MECSNDGQMSLWLQRFARENSADRVRNRIVNVKEIQILLLRHFRHLGCERQGVGLMLKQRIRHHLNFMEAHALIELRKPRWQSGSDEVDGVTSCREFLPQLRTYDATATISW